MARKEPEPLAPYSESSPCPKCLWAEVSTRYANGRTLSSHHRCSDGCPYGWNIEHMERECGRCGYQWAQACASEES